MLKIFHSWYQSLRSRPRLSYELGFFGVILLTIAFCLLPLRHEGWPLNHEGLAFANRTAIVADHLKQGDIFPVWSSSDAYAMGTPLPLFYHKTFYYVSGPIFAVTDAMKFSIVTAIVVFMMVGAYGMRAAISRFTNKKVLLFAGPVALLLSNYMFTDWLIRGAMAEFSALLLVPWLVWWCLVLIQEQRYSLWIVPIFFAMFHAHNITAFFGMFILIIAGGIFLMRGRVAGFKKVWKKALVSAGLLLLLFAPQLLMQKALLSDYNPGKITQEGFQASENFKLPNLYFFNEEYEWLENWRTYTVQIDYAIWIPLGIGLLVLVADLIGWRRKTLSWLRDNLATATFAFLALALALMFLFQLEFMKPVFERVDVLQYLQFPWRLLAFITPLGILLIMYIVSRFNYRPLIFGFVAVWLGMFVVFSPLFHHFQHGFIPKALVNSLGEWQPGGMSDSLTGIGEYLPRVVKADGTEMQTREVLNLYKDLYTQQRQAEVLEGSCTIARLPETSFDSTTIRLLVSCAEDSLVALPTSYTKFHEVRLMGGNPQQLERIRRADDPRVIVKLPKGEHLAIEVKLPTVPKVLFGLL